MNQKQSVSLLAIDIQIRVRSRLYRLEVRDALKWLVPLLVVLSKLITEFRRSGS